MVSIAEGSAKLDDGYDVYTKTWTAAEPKARLLFVHGFSDHCNNYKDFFTYLAEQGISVHAFDQRGWGRSTPTQAHKGLTGPSTRVLRDISNMLSPLVGPSSTLPRLPTFLAGHSMGGAEVLSYLSLDPDHLCSSLRGVIAIAPLVSLHPSTRPWKITVLAGRAVKILAPKRQMVNKLDPALLSHDQPLNLEWAADPLNHDTGTLEGLDGMLDRGAKLESGVWKIAEGKNEGGKTRVLVCHGTADGINDYQGSKDYVEKSISCEDKKLESYDGWYHNLHVETIGKGKEGFRKDIAEWVTARLG